MGTFNTWLYQNYILPYQERQREDSPYALWLSLADCDLFPQDRPLYEKCREFYSVESFLLGLRTGAALAGAFERPPEAP